VRLAWPKKAMMLLSQRHARGTSRFALLLALAIPIAAVWFGSTPVPAEARSTSSAKHAHHARSARRGGARHTGLAPRHGLRRHSYKRALHPRLRGTPPPTVSPPVNPPVTPPSGPPAPTPTSPELPSGGSGSSPAPALSVTCTLVAAPGGSDTTGDGSLARPFQSVVKLDEALAAGQTGCLRGGTYGGVSTLHRLSNSGNASGQITITAYPGETPRVAGWVDVEASYTTISSLQIDGSNTFYTTSAGSPCPSPHNLSQALVLAGTGDVFERNNYYESVPGLRGVGIGVGFWGNADNTVIRYNRIHDVGQCKQYDHLIYLASGNNVQIYDNWLYNNHNGFGVSVYPRPTNARIFSNVINSAGSGIGLGDNGTSASRGNRAWHNVVTNGVRVPADPSGFLQAALVLCPGLDASSTGNEVLENDSFGNPDGIASVNSHISAERVVLSGNISVDPRFVNAAANDYGVPSSSPVASWGLWNGA
jgi:hypothetical protein